MLNSILEYSQEKMYLLRLTCLDAIVLNAINISILTGERKNGYFLIDLQFIVDLIPTISYNGNNADVIDGSIKNLENADVLMPKEINGKTWYQYGNNYSSLLTDEG